MIVNNDEYNDEYNYEIITKSLRNNYEIITKYIYLENNILFFLKIFSNYNI